MGRKALLATSIICLPATALAQSVADPYVSLGAGPNYLEPEQLKEISVGIGLIGNISGNLVDKNVNFGSGLATIGGVGWSFGNGVRVDLEGDHRGNHQNQNGKSLNLNVVTRVKSGAEQKSGVMVDSFHDFTDAVAPGVTSYIEAGTGWQHIFGDTTEIPGAFPAGPFASSLFKYDLNGGASAFVYQGIIGVAYALASVDPGLLLTVGCRFFGADGNRSHKGDLSSADRVANANLSFEPEANHAIVLGVRYVIGE